ncbi:unnamed protein product [Schistocephalus solidus]|uniref:Uncharacterized protein n=1 Tax=Schistocephalus solidus TaxID=70667 RepID=A0A183TR40_SCHSO|nr:unnamed protein product [Schistocephalus solidus]
MRFDNSGFCSENAGRYGLNSVISLSNWFPDGLGVTEEAVVALNTIVPRQVPGISVFPQGSSPVDETSLCEDVQGSCLDDTPLRSGDLDRLLEPSQEAESLPSPLPPQDTKAEMARQDTRHESLGADRNPQHPRHAEASVTVMERPPDVATGAHRQRVQKRRYKDTLKKSLKQLQINPATWEDLTQDRPALRRSVKTGSAIHEANRITTAKAKRAARKSPAPRTDIVDAQALSTCPRCQRIFHARISLSANPLSDCPTLTPGITYITHTIIETKSIYSSPVTTTTATTTAFAFTTTTSTISDEDSLLNCPQCECTFTSHIGLVVNL